MCSLDCARNMALSNADRPQDKLVDELAKGRPMPKILRESD